VPGPLPRVPVSPASRSLSPPPSVQQGPRERLRTREPWALSGSPPQDAEGESPRDTGDASRVPAPPSDERGSKAREQPGPREVPRTREPWTERQRKSPGAEDSAMRGTKGRR